MRMTNGNYKGNMRLEDRVMAAVHDIWLMRKIRSALMLRFGAMAVVGLIGSFYISYGSIAENVAGVAGVGSFLAYIADAIQTTELAVKGLVFLAGVLGLMLVWDTGRFLGLLMSRTAMHRRQSDLSRARQFYR